MTGSAHNLLNAIRKTQDAFGNQVVEAAGAAVLAASGFPGQTCATFLNGADYGLVPDTGVDLTTNLQAALTAARIAGKPVSLVAGKYIYKAAVSNAGGGLICSAGLAWLDNQDPAYASVVIDFQSTDASYLSEVTVQGIRFTCSTRPDTGLTNGAVEEAGFIRVTKARNVKIWGNDLSHNHGGGVLLRDVQGFSVVGNKLSDLFKDGLHFTDTTNGGVVGYNIIKGNGDDAIACVGYPTKGSYPSNIQIIGNQVFGVRFARGYAIVGARDIELTGNYIDGRVPADIPQKTDGVGAYNTACGLYIAAESNGASSTYGCENIKVRGFVGEYLCKGKDTAGAASTYNQIHVTSYNGATYPIKGVKIEATLRNGSSRGIFVAGNGYLSDVEADITVEDNTDPLGLSGTAGAASQPAVEFQGTRNIKCKVRANKIGKGAIYADTACTGYGVFESSVGAICQTSVQSVITIPTGSQFDVVDFWVNFESVPAASGTGSINRIIDNPNQGITRSTRITGVDHGTGASNKLNGWPARAITLGASGLAVLNTTGRPLLISMVQGTVSAIARAGVKGRVAAASIGSTTVVNVLGDVSDIYASGQVVSFFDSKGIQISGTATVSGTPTYTASTNITQITFAAAFPAAFVVGMQMAIINTMKTLAGRTSGVIELPPETAVQVTYSVAPGATSITDASF